MKNKNNKLNIFLIKIIWLEVNKNYILTIIQLFNVAKNIIYKNKNQKIFLEQIINLIKAKKIKYITDEVRNPEHTTDVNECFYIILGALYLSITNLDKIILYDPDNHKDYVDPKENQVKVEIYNYIKCLKYIVKVSQPLNDMLYLFSNELYIIINLNSILNLLKIQKNEYIDIQIVEKIIKNLQKNNDIIQESKFVKINEFKKNIEELITLINENLQNKDKDYYSLIKNILLQEFKKIKNKNYRLDLFKSYIINEKKILLISNDIFDLLLKGYVFPEKEKLLPSLEKFENKEDEILKVLENKIKEKNNEYLSQILLYYFEKIFNIYFNNYFKSKPQNKEKILFEKEPLKVFEKCLELLSKFISSNSLIKNVSKLLYIGYIRVFLFKFEEYIREKSEKLIEPKDVIKSMNKIKNEFSFMIELYYCKVIYNKNNKDKKIFKSENNLYNLNLLNLQINDDNINENNNITENSYINLLEENNNNSINSEEEDDPFKKYFYYSDYLNEKYLAKIVKDNFQGYPVLHKYLELKNNGNILNDFYTYNSIFNLLYEKYSSKITREYANKIKLEEELIYKNNKELFTKFFDIYNKLSDYNENDDNSIENDNDNNNMHLNPSLPLFKFFIIDENEFSKKYKYIL